MSNTRFFHIILSVRKGIIPIISFLILSILLPACSNDEPTPNPPDEPAPSLDRDVKTAILIYAVASNNLNSSFSDDLNESGDLYEMLEAAEQINLNEADVVIYSVELQGDVQLRRIVKDDAGKPGLQLIKEYDRNTFSTDPKRISEVINDFIELDKCDRRGLILWSHATGWEPDFSDHIVPIANYSFGADKYNGKYDYCDLIELNEAIPEGVFDYIWFDCCYMMQIESIYQLRNKARYFVGSPMEMAGEGTPYHLVLPLLARPDYNLADAIEIEARYFINRNIPIAISLLDATYLDEVMQAARLAAKGKRQNTLGLISYSRTPVGSLYDFSGFTERRGASLGAEWDSDYFSELMERLLPCRFAGEKNWSNRPIDPAGYSGLAVHNFNDDGDDVSEYYKQLAWYRDVYDDF